jgi:hypothetical protein
MIRVHCKNCGASDDVTRDHPGVRRRPDGQREFWDRSALRHVHAEGCEPGEDGNYPLTFEFMAG